MQGLRRLTQDRVSGIANGSFGLYDRPFSESRPVKVIASSLRKGNVVDKDGKLHVILFAENIHPGKGTPVTQLEHAPHLRRGEGVGALPHDRAGRARPCEDREHTFLY